MPLEAPEAAVPLLPVAPLDVAPLAAVPLDPPEASVPLAAILPLDPVALDTPEDGVPLLGAEAPVGAPDPVPVTDPETLAPDPDET